MPYEKILMNRRNKRRMKRMGEVQNQDPISDELYDETNLHLRTFEYKTNNLIMRDTDYFVISTGNKQIFKKGEEIFNCYGKFSNDYLLNWYGFCYMNNKYDKLKIRLKFPNKEEGFFFFKYLQYIFPRLYIEEEDYIVLKFPLKQKILNLELIKYATFFYFFENDLSQEYFSYTFHLEYEIKIIENIINLLQITKRKKKELTTLEEDIKIYNEINQNNDNFLRYKYRDRKSVV